VPVDFVSDWGFRGYCAVCFVKLSLMETSPRHYYHHHGELKNTQLGERLIEQVPQRDWKTFTRHHTICHGVPEDSKLNLNIKQSEVELKCYGATFRMVNIFCFQ
jgi:hypothetical protein